MEYQTGEEIHNINEIMKRADTAAKSLKKSSTAATVFVFILASPFLAILGLILVGGLWGIITS